MLALAACETPAVRGGEPSLAPRVAERIDPRLPVEAAVDARPADPALLARLDALAGQARSAAAAFAAFAPRVRAAADAAGAPTSESWIAAQHALSELERTRAPFTAALAEIDQLHAARVRGATASAADLAALEAASAELRALDQRQAETLDSIRMAIAG